MHWLDATLLLGFVLYAVSNGLRTRRQASRNLEEYFLAGRTLSGTKAGISMAATQFAADTPLLVTGLVATAGVFALWRLWIYAIAFLLMGFVLGPAWRRARVLTDAELTELRYGERAGAVLRGVKAVYFGAIFNCTVLAMVLWAAKEIAEPFLRWHEWLPPSVFEPLREAVLAVGLPFAREAGSIDVWTRSADNLVSIGAIVGLTTLYSATGGLRSVVATDVVQFGIMMAGTAAYAVVVVVQVGGLGAMQNRLARAAQDSSAMLSPEQLLAFTPDRAAHAGAAVLAVIGLQWLIQINADGTGYLAQRTMACRSDTDATRAAVVFTLLQILLRSLLWLPIALGLILLYPVDSSASLESLRAQREVTFVSGINDLLPPGLKGLMLTGMLAALASTVDTHLNWGSSYFTNDLYRRFVCRSWLRRTPSGRELVWVARGSNLLVLGLALVIMTQLSSIQHAWHTSLLFGAGLGPLLLLRWAWWRITARGEISAIVASTVLAPGLLAFGPDSEALRLLIMGGAATTVGVVASLVWRPEPMGRLVEFYSRTQASGFWGPVAQQLGEGADSPRRRLGRGVMATVVGSLSVFCLLTGVGSWLVGSPAPRWCPSRPLWIFCLIAIAVGVFPWVWRLGIRGQPLSREAEAE